MQDGPPEEGEATPNDQKDAEAWRRRRENLSKAASAVRRQVSGLEVFDDTETHGRGPSYAAEEIHASTPSRPRSRQVGKIKGIPKAAGIGTEGHIY
jgi:hypothetical protein